MTSYLIALSPEHEGQVLVLSDATEWIIGRDSDKAKLVIEDATVSRQHAMIHLEGEEYTIENLSSTNPVRINGNPVEEPTPLLEGDILSIGNTEYQFTYEAPKEKEFVEDEPAHETTEIPSLSFTDSKHARWILKVIAGPNTGAEFPLQKNHTYILGKDPSHCDIFFLDISVSKQHAKLIVDESEQVTIEDIGSKNGIYVNQKKCELEQSVQEEDVIALGTTSFVVMDTHGESTTLYTPPVIDTSEEENQEQEWKRITIPYKHLVLGGVLALGVIVSFGGALSVFRSKEIEIQLPNEAAEIKKVLTKFPGVEFTYHPQKGTIFLLGHISTEIQHQEMTYLLQSLPYISRLDDNVIIDELVWENANAIIYKNPNWRSVIVTSPKPGKFIIKGYLDSTDEAAKLSDYLNQNFPHIDKLENQVVVESNLQTQIQSFLIQRGLTGITFQLSGGELLLAGQVSKENQRVYNETKKDLEKINGVSSLKSYVVFTKETDALIDLSQRYSVSGSSKYGNTNEFVLINGKILSQGDLLDGMRIVKISAHQVQLEKEGLKYKIDYNL